MNDFLLLLVVLVGGVAALLLPIIIEGFISPKVKAVGVGTVAVESAERPLFSARTVGFQYYFYAVMFVISEAMIVLLFLWAGDVKGLGLYVFSGVGVSLLFLIVLVRYLMYNEENIID